MTQRAIAPGALDAMPQSLNRFAARAVPLSWRQKADVAEERPREIIEQLMNEIGLHPIFIPEEYGGVGGGAYEELEKIQAGLMSDLDEVAAELTGREVTANPLASQRGID